MCVIWAGPGCEPGGPLTKKKGERPILPISGILAFEPAPPVPEGRHNNQLSYHHGLTILALISSTCLDQKPSGFPNENSPTAVSYPPTAKKESGSLNEKKKCERPYGTPCCELGDVRVTSCD